MHGKNIGCGWESAWVNKEPRKRNTVRRVREEMGLIVVVGNVIAGFGFEGEDLLFKGDRRKEE